jgi:hypothetical protein|tara:strand:- start:2871 stop:3218 length:348 start_codon:yes stop_codon:yes gene_type:complete
MTTRDYNLYGGNPPHQDSKTSKSASDSIKSSVGNLHKKVLSYFSHGVGWTDEEIQILTQLPPNTARPRRRELVLMGKLKNSGKFRKTKSGRKAIVWILGDNLNFVSVEGRSDGES